MYVGTPIAQIWQNPHILRHTACTRLAEAGIDPKALQVIMGHSDIATTMDIYNHADYERIQNEMKKAEILYKVKGYGPGKYKFIEEIHPF